MAGPLKIEVALIVSGKFRDSAIVSIDVRGFWHDPAVVKSCGLLFLRNQPIFLFVQWSAVASAMHESYDIF